MPHNTGHTEWLVRMRVRPHGVDSLAGLLAERADTTWVTVLSSGTELVCIVRVAGDGPAPLAALSRHPHVTDVSAQRLLRHLMDHCWRGRTSALTAAEVDALRPPALDVPPEAG
jgi:hypothetical protein